MYKKNKKGQGIGNLILLIVTVIFFFAVFPFWNGMFKAAADIHTGILADVINFIPFIILIIVLIKVVNLDASGAD